LFTNDALTARADAYLRAHTPIVLLSDFAAAEFASAISRRVRMAELTAIEAQAVFTNFDTWTARATQRIETVAADVKAAAVFLRRLDLTLRTPDALNIAIAERAAAILVTFDEKMATCARAFGMTVAT
jgi:predicted nucleic acid-binding protein